MLKSRSLNRHFLQRQEPSTSLPHGLNLIFIGSIPAAGCHNLRGTWEGSCSGDDGDIGLSISVDADTEGEIEGEAIASFPVGGGEVGTDLVVEGTRKGREFSLELDSSGWAISLGGEHRGGILEGDCLLAITVLGSTVVDEGEFWLAPVE